MPEQLVATFGGCSGKEGCIQAELQDERGEQAAADHYLTAKTIANRRRVELEAKLGLQLNDLGN